MTVLLRQPHGLEGVVFMSHGLHSHDLSSTEGEEHEIRVVNIDSTCPALAVLDDMNQNGVTDGLNPFRLDRESLPLLKDAARESREPSRAREHTELREVGTNDED